MIIGGASGRGFLSDLMGNLCIFWIMFGVLFGVIWGAPGLSRGQIFFFWALFAFDFKKEKGPNRQRANLGGSPWGGLGGLGGAGGPQGQPARQPGSQAASQAARQAASQPARQHIGPQWGHIGPE